MTLDLIRMENNYIVVLGGSELQLPIIEYLIANNLKNILVFDFDIDCIVSKLNIVEFVNISSIDHIKISEFLKKQNILIKAIITNSDRAILTKSKLDCEFNLSGIKEQIAFLSIDKIQQLDYCFKNSIKHPLYSIINKNYNINKINYFPGVLKPTQSSGSRGVIKINNFNELNKGIDKLKNYNYNFLVYQEYISGDEYSIEGFIINGYINIIGITEKIKFKSEEYFVESGHIFPAEIDSLLEEKIIYFTKSLLKPLGSISVPFHVEVKVKDNEIVLIEFALRLGGDFITSKLIPYSTGINPIEILVKINLKSKDLNYRLKKPFKKVGISFGKDVLKFKKIIEDKSNFKDNIKISSLDRSGYIIGYL